MALFVNFESVQSRANKSFDDGYQILISFFFPALIMSEFIGLERGCFTQNFKHTIVNGFLSTVMNAGIFYCFIELLSAYGVEPFAGICIPHKMILSLLYNMRDDTGYRMILTQVRDKQLYELSRDKISTNFIITIFGIYCASEAYAGSMKTDGHPVLSIFRNSFLILVISNTLGIALGASMAILQSSIKAIRDDVSTEVMFTFCVCYFVSFVGSIKSVYLCEDLGLIMLGCTLSAYGRYNLSLDSAERLNFLLQLISRLCRMAILSFAGVIAVYQIYTSMKWMALLWTYLGFLTITFTTHTIGHFVLKLWKADRRKPNWKEFFLAYFAGIIKGPTVFIIAAKYSIENPDVLSLTYCFLATSTILTSPIIFMIAKYYKPEEVSEEQYVADLMTYKYLNMVACNTAPRSAVWRFFSFLGKGVLGRILIYDFDKRSEDGVFEGLRQSFYINLRKLEVTMMSMRVDKNMSRSEVLGKNELLSKNDVRCLFTKLFSNAKLTTDADSKRRDSFIVNFSEGTTSLVHKEENKLL